MEFEDYLGVFVPCFAALVCFWGMGMHEQYMQDRLVGGPCIQKQATP